MSRKKRKQLEMEDIVDLFREAGYEGVWLGDKWDERVYDIQTDKLRVSVFASQYGHPRLQGSVAAETQETFNKWTQAYLIKPWPRNKKQFEKLLKDLEIIQQPEHVEAANNFESYES